MRLALFDLDNTLLPIDSDHAWSEFLGEVGAIDAHDYARRNDAFYEQYKAGTLVIEDYLRFALAPLAAHPRTQLDDWHRRFMAERIAPHLAHDARELVRRHTDVGDLCAVVTATNEFVTAPIAAAFGIEHLIAVQLERDGERFTGRHAGTPSFREGKIVRVLEWLDGLGLPFDRFDESWFYSDSINDLPLLERVTHPVATNPDERLARIASARGWPVVHLFESSDR